jgi:kynurenine formamidase
VHWLADKGIGMFGVEAVSPSPEGELNFRAHQICGERGITHMECLFNLEKLVGRGRVRFAVDLAALFALSRFSSKQD